MILGLHSLLFPTKVKAAAAIILSDQAHDFLIRFSLTNQVGGSSCSAALHGVGEVFLNQCMAALIKAALLFQ